MVSEEIFSSRDSTATALLHPKQQVMRFTAAPQEELQRGSRAAFSRASLIRAIKNRVPLMTSTLTVDEDLLCLEMIEVGIILASRWILDFPM